VSSSFQVEVRCRIRGAVGEMLHGLPRRARSRAVAALLSATAEGVDVHALLAARDALRAVGVLLNQSLRYSHAEGLPDAQLKERVLAVVRVVEALCQTGRAE